MISTTTPYYQSASPAPLAKLSRQVLTLPETADAWLKKELAKNPGPLKRFMQERLHWAANNLMSWDVNGFPKAVIPGLRRFLGDLTMTESPMAVMSLCLLGFTMLTRIEIAKKRERPDDLTKETMDIFIRDTTAMVLCLFLLRPFVRFLNRTVFQKLGHLPLVNGLNMVTYADMRQNLVVQSANHLKSLWQEPTLKKALTQSVQELNDKGLAKLGYTPLAQAITSFKQSALGALSNPSSVDHVGLYQQLQNLDKLLQQAKVHGAKTGNQPLVKAAFRIADNYKYTEFLSYFANRFRVPADLVSFFTVVILAGWLPLALTNLFSLRAVKKYQDAHKDDPIKPAMPPKKNKAGHRLLNQHPNSLAFAAFNP
jgi:hypothetical protein